MVELIELFTVVEEKHAEREECIIDKFVEQEEKRRLAYIEEEERRHQEEKWQRTLMSFMQMIVPIAGGQRWNLAFSPPVFPPSSLSIFL